MGELFLRAVLVLAGLACVGCEMWGAYDFMWEKHGRWNYLVVGGLVLTSLAAILPLGAEYAHRRKMHGLKWSAWFGVPIALAFVFTVSIQRTGTDADTDETARQQIANVIKIAQTEQAEAMAQLPIDKALVKRNCDVWGKVCDKAKADQRATEKKLADARAVLKRQGVEVDDSMAKRIVAYLPFLTKEQVLLYQPMLLPLGLAFLGSVLIAIGIRGGKPIGEKRPGFVARWRARLAARSPTKSMHSENVSTTPAIIATEQAAPVPLPENVVQLTPKLRAAQEEPEEELDPTDVIAYLKERMIMVDGEDLDYVDIWPKWEAWCLAQTPPKDPLDPRKLALILNYIVQRAKIPLRRKGRRTILKNRKLIG